MLLPLLLPCFSCRIGQSLNCDLWVSQKDIKEWTSSLQWDHSHFPLLAKGEQQTLPQEQVRGKTSTGISLAFLEST